MYSSCVYFWQNEKYWILNYSSWCWYGRLHWNKLILVLYLARISRITELSYKEYHHKAFNKKNLKCDQLKFDELVFSVFFLWQWHRTTTTQETDGFQVKRPGDRNVRCTVLLLLDYQVWLVLRSSNVDEKQNILLSVVKDNASPSADGI